MSLRDRLSPLLTRWNALEPREQRFLLIGSAAVLVTLLYLLAIEPLLKADKRRANDLSQARTLAVRLEEVAAEVQTAAKRGPAAGTNRSLSLLSAVDQAAKSNLFGKAPARIQPEGDKQVKLWFEDAQFDSLIAALPQLETRYGISIQAADIERQPGAGLVNAQLTLIRP